MVKDPVCGMEIDPAEAVATRSANGSDYYFCSAQCVETFDVDPHRYMHGAITETSPAAVIEKSLVGSATTGYNPELKGPVQMELPIAGLTCSTCVTTVERSLKEVPGVEQAHVNFSLGKAHVTYDPERVTADSLVGAVKKAGYNVGAAEMRVRISPGLHCASCAAGPQLYC
ncbi:MAG: cation transporter [Chloroflexota bacterium]